MSNSSSLTPPPPPPPLIGGGVADRDVPGLRVLAHDGGVAADEADPGELLGPLVKTLEVLAVGADVVVEDGASGFGVVVLGQDHLFLGVGAADRRAVAVLPRGDPPGAHAVNPGDVVRVLLVRPAQDLALVGAGCAEQPLVVHAGDHVFELFVPVIPVQGRVVGIIARCQDDRPPPGPPYARRVWPKSMAPVLQTDWQIPHFFSLRKRQLSSM